MSTLRSCLPLKNDPGPNFLQRVAETGVILWYSATSGQREPDFSWVKARAGLCTDEPFTNQIWAFLPVARYGRIPLSSHYQSSIDIRASSRLLDQ